MAEFINTIDVLGDDAVIDSIIDRTITEFKDDQITKVGAFAFHNCTALTEVDLPNVAHIGDSGFQSCSALNTVELPNVLTLGSWAFNGCTSLETIYLPECVGKPAGVYPGSWFYDCKALKRAVFPKMTYGGMMATFNGCNKLEYVDYAATDIGDGTFKNCYSLKVVVLRSNTVSTLNVGTSAFANCYHLSGTVNSTYNPNGDKDCYIYVPRSLIEDYKVATNWSTHASQFRALEDYTVDGTITGEFDETKI